jgi:hypothetical protein
LPFAPKALLSLTVLRINKYQNQESWSIKHSMIYLFLKIWFNLIVNNKVTPRIV